MNHMVYPVNSQRLGRSQTAKCSARKVETNIWVFANGTTGNNADPVRRLQVAPYWPVSEGQHNPKTKREGG
jgi:hypothetical protein